MKCHEVLGGLALVTLLSACAAPPQKQPPKVESVLDVINRAQPAASGAVQCPPGAVPVCMRAFRSDPQVCTCGDPLEMQHAFDFKR